MIAVSAQSIPIKLQREKTIERASACVVNASQLPELEEKVGSILHPEELRQYQALSLKKRRGDYLLGRYAGKVAAGAWLGEENLALLEIGWGVFHQPILHYSTRNVPDVCIAHSEGRSVAIAFPREHPLAVDIELVSPDRLDTLRTQVDEEEVSVFAPESHSEMYARIWTAKEALSKVLRTGLTCPFEVLRVERTFMENEVMSGTFQNFAQYAFHSYMLENFALTIVHPERTVLTMDLEAMAQALG